MRKLTLKQEKPGTRIVYKTKFYQPQVESKSCNKKAELSAPNPE